MKYVTTTALVDNRKPENSLCGFVSYVGDNPNEAMKAANEEYDKYAQIGFRGEVFETYHTVMKKGSEYVSIIVYPEYDI